MNSSPTRIDLSSLGRARAAQGLFLILAGFAGLLPIVSLAYSVLHYLGYELAVCAALIAVGRFLFRSKLLLIVYAYGRWLIVDRPLHELANAYHPHALEVVCTVVGLASAFTLLPLCVIFAIRAVVLRHRVRVMNVDLVRLRKVRPPRRPWIDPIWRGGPDVVFRLLTGIMLFVGGSLLAFVIAKGYVYILAAAFGGWFMYSAQVRFLATRPGQRSDTRPPILFLRSFEVERDATVTGPWDPTGRYESELDKVAHELAQAGPLVALAAVGAEMPAPFVVGDIVPVLGNDWQTTVRRQMERAVFIIMLPDVSPGILWELEQIMCDEELLSKTLLWFDNDVAWVQLQVEFQKLSSPAAQRLATLTEVASSMVRFTKTGDIVQFVTDHWLDRQEVLQMFVAPR